MRLYSKMDPFPSDTLYLHHQIASIFTAQYCTTEHGLSMRRVMRQEAIETGAFNVLLTHYDLAIRDKSVLRKVSLFLTLLSSYKLLCFCFTDQVFQEADPLLLSMCSCWSV